MSEMTYRPLGRSGLMVSVAGLGCNNFGRRIGFDRARPVVKEALEQGITLFDTADNYDASEEWLGQLLQGHRHDVVIATKFGMSVGGDNGADWGARASRRYIRRAVERSLRRLRTDWIDLYQLHRPDGITPIEETLGALSELVTEGKVRYIGCSNVAAWQVADADWVARTRGLERFISVQNEYSLLNRDIEAEVVPACERFGLGVLPYYPLARGLLTGKFRRGQPAPEGTRLRREVGEHPASDAQFDVIEKLEEFARERSLSLVDVAIAGLAAQPAVASVISGATSPEQLRANVAATRWTPSTEDLRILDDLTGSPRRA